MLLCRHGGQMRPQSSLWSSQLQLLPRHLALKAGLCSCRQPWTEAYPISHKQGGPHARTLAAGEVQSIPVQRRSELDRRSAVTHRERQALLLGHLLLHSLPGLLVQLVYAAADGSEAAGGHSTHLCTGVSLCPSCVCVLLWQRTWKHCNQAPSQGTPHGRYTSYSRLLANLIDPRAVCTIMGGCLGPAS